MECFHLFSIFLDISEHDGMENNAVFSKYSGKKSRMRNWKHTDNLREMAYLSLSG
jgi:uncharacterized protein (DUF1697 family)